MSKTLLAEVVGRQVQSATVATISREADRIGEEIAADLLRDPEFHAEVRQLAREAFKAALIGLRQESTQE